MGQFSWLYSDTGKQVLDDEYADTYLLIPTDFGGGYIKEECYDGYGNFGGKDVYDLIPEWNKSFIPTLLDLAKKGEWKCSVNEETENNLNSFLADKPITCEKRWLGIVMACCDEDNERLPYPIKITEKPMTYEWVSPSKRDPNQGWKVDEFDEDYWF